LNTDIDKVAALCTVKTVLHIFAIIKFL